MTIHTIQEVFELFLTHHIARSDSIYLPLHGHQFLNEEVTDMVHTWLHMQLKTFFVDGIRKLVEGSNKCVLNYGITSKNCGTFVLVYLL